MLIIIDKFINVRQSLFGLTYLHILEIWMGWEIFGGEFDEFGLKLIFFSKK
jgi:hypothetical protein